MGEVVVRYRVRPDAVDENIRLIKRVFAELGSLQPADIRYASLQLDDGVSFVHVASFDAGDGALRLAALSEFAAFTNDIARRCADPPVGGAATIVGDYRLLDRTGG
jgi:hypothetical protein